MILAGFFSAIETAFISSEPLAIKRRIPDNPGYAKYILSVVNNPEHFLSVLLVGTNIAVVSASSFFTLFLITKNVNNPEFVATLFLVPLFLFFSEVLPKNIGRAFQHNFLLRFIFLIWLMDKFLSPLVFIFDRSSSFFKNKLSKKKRMDWTKDELKILAQALHSQGELERMEKEAIEDVFGFSRVRIKDILTPLNKVVGVDYIESREDIFKKAKTYGFTRYPVFKNMRITGYLNIFDFFFKDSTSWQELIRPIVKVSINQRSAEVFSYLKKKKENISLVLKGNKVAGIITLQDLMREITLALSGE